MRIGFKFWVIVLIICAIASAGWAQPTASELRTRIQDQGETVDARVGAMIELSQQAITPGREEEFLELTELILKSRVNRSQYGRVAAIKAETLIKLGEPEWAKAWIDSTFSMYSEEEIDPEPRFHLYYQRGRAKRRTKGEGNSNFRAIPDYEIALGIAEKMGSIEMQSMAHDALGYAHKRLRDLSRASEHYAWIMRFSDMEEDRAQARYNIAGIYDENPVMRDTALSYMMEARDFFVGSDQRKAAIATVGIATTLRDMKRTNEAVAEFERALTMSTPKGHLVKCYENLGQIALDQTRVYEAMLHFQNALKLDSDNGKAREVYILTKMGKTLIEVGEGEQGLALCDSILQVVLNDESLDDYNRATRLSDCYDCISYVQFAMGKYREASAARDLHDSAQQAFEASVAEDQARLNMELIQYDGLREEEKRKVMDKQKDDQRRLLMVIVLLLIAFAIFITSRYRFTRKQSRLISTQRQQLQDRQRELIRANAELEIALNHKAVFLSNMSHEIRTPLNAIVGMSNLATKEQMAEGARKYLRNIVTASSNLIDIVNDILDFSKLEAGKLEIAQEPFCVQDALEVAENVMRIPAEQKDLTFTVEADPDMPSHIMGDASRLNQVLINLVGNAIKFTLEGGVTMQAEVGPLPDLPPWCPTPEKSHPQWFVVRVTDTGIGIPEDKLEKIFESFNQGDQLKTRKFGGTGLGLSISKQIVELQGGAIWVESVEGEGSTFAFALPAIVTEMGQELEIEQIDEGEIGPLRILIAEDNPFNVIVTEDTLNSELTDLTIGKAENGRVAFEMVRDEDWDLVLMDVHMPEMSGLEATSAIRKLSNHRASTLIIAMTASVLREETESYMRHGMDGFVPKPFQVEQLISEIRRLRKTSATKEPPKLPPLRILIAEDNPFNVIVAEDTLRSELPDVTIGKAENGKLAFEAVRDEDWDIVLMDIAMPEMTGLEATAAIRKLPDEHKAKTTIIAMTASVLKEETDHYLKKGMNGFVPKPFKVEQLLGEIHRTIQEKS